MKKELEIIQQLMEELQEQMNYDESDFSERLGRKKPEVEALIGKPEVKIMKIEGEMPSDEMSEDMDQSEDMHESMEEESPEEKLKQRLMKLRG